MAMLANSPEGTLCGNTIKNIHHPSPTVKPISISTNRPKKRVHRGANLNKTHHVIVAHTERQEKRRKSELIQHPSLLQQLGTIEFYYSL